MRWIEAIIKCWPAVLLSILLIGTPGSQGQPAPSAKRAITRVVSDQTATTATITIYFDDARALVLYVPTGGNIVQAAAVAAPGGKLADVADATSTLTLRAGPIPGLPTAVPTAKPIQDAAAPPVPPKLEVPAALDNARSAVAAILAENGKGAGAAVLVATDRAVTSTAVIGDVKKVRLRFPGGAELPGTVVQSDPASGLALIQVVSGKRAGLVMGKAAVNEKVFAVSSPYGQGDAVRVGTLTGLNQTVKVNGAVLADMLQTDTKVEPANRGSALVNAKGELLGIACSWPDVEGNFAVPVASVTALLAKGGE